MDTQLEAKWRKISTTGQRQKSIQTRNMNATAAGKIMHGLAVSGITSSLQQGRGGIHRDATNHVKWSPQATRQDTMPRAQGQQLGDKCRPVCPQDMAEEHRQKGNLKNNCPRV